MIGLKSGRGVAVKGTPEDIVKRLQQTGDYTGTEGHSDANHFPDAYLIFAGLGQFERPDSRSPVYVRATSVASSVTRSRCSVPMLSSSSGSCA